MAKVLVYEVDNKERQDLVKELFLILSSLNSLDDVFTFLSGFVTPSEALMFGRRIQVAKSLISGSTHDEIRKKLKVSYQTITKIEHWLKADEGRHLFIKRKIGSSASNKKRKKADGEYSMLNKYAKHQLWKELLG